MALRCVRGRPRYLLILLLCTKRLAENIFQHGRVFVLTHLILFVSQDPCPAAMMTSSCHAAMTSRCRHAMTSSDAHAHARERFSGTRGQLSPLGAGAGAGAGAGVSERSSGKARAPCSVLGMARAPRARVLPEGIETDGRCLTGDSKIYCRILKKGRRVG